MDEQNPLKTLRFTETVPNAAWSFRTPEDEVVDQAVISDGLTADESPHGDALRISVPGDNALVHTMEPLVCDRVVIRCLREWSPIYIRLSVRDHRRRAVPDAYLLIDPSGASPGHTPERRVGAAGRPLNEWTIHPQTDMIGDGLWERITVDIMREFAASFGAAGCTLIGVDGIVIRGNCTISTVDFFAV